MTTIRSDFATTTTAPLDIYVSDINGNDANSGFSPALALKTYNKAIDKIPNGVYHTVRVHFGAHGGAGYQPKTLFSRDMRENLWLIGDGAGQAGEDGFTVQLGVTAAIAGSGASVIVTGGGLGVNAYLGMTVEVLTGAAAGDRRTIRNNTATDVVPCVAFSAAVAATDTFRIVTPSVKWAIPSPVSGADFMFIQDCATPGSDILFTQEYRSPAVYICNIQMTSGAATDGYVITGSRVIFVGVDCPSVVTNTPVPKPFWRISEIGLGFDHNMSAGSGSTFNGVLAAVTDLGVASSAKWRGWGLSYRTAATGSVTTASGWFGTFVAPSITVAAGTAALNSGNCFGPGTGGTAVLGVSAGAKLAINNNPAGPAILVSSTTGMPALLANGGLIQFVSGNLTVANTGGPGAGTAQAGVLLATTGLTGTGSTVGVRSTSGGRALFSGAVGVTGPGGVDLTIDDLVTSFAAGDLAAAGDALSNLNGSLISRI